MGADSVIRVARRCREVGDDLGDIDRDRRRAQRLHGPNQRQFFGAFLAGLHMRLHADAIGCREAVGRKIR
jgi:hypothetical protein